MNDTAILDVIRSALAALAEDNEDITVPSEDANLNTPLSELGLDVISFSELILDLETRFDNRDLGLSSLMVPETFVDTTLGKLFERIQNRVGQRENQAGSLVVYVDDEEENLFVFRRKLGKELNIKTFSDPTEALDFIAKEADVALVITDEVMPGMRGNELCDEVKKVKPYMKFILITGNPENDDNLMYRSLRQNRFYDFIQKPVDFDGKKEKYLTMIRDIVGRKVS
jgi:CheY-like chemotaxis protein